MKRGYRILYLEDQERDVGRVGDLLKREYLPCELVWVQGWEAFLDALKGAWGFDLLLAAEPQAGLPCQEALELAGRRRPHLPVILLADGADDDMAAEWMRQGAADVVAKSAPARLAPAVRRALRESRDLAGLREAEAENARMASLLRTVLESTREGILVVDLAGRITTYNRKFMSLCGIPEYVMAPMDLERVLRFLQDQFADPEAFLRQARALGDQGERRPLGLLAGLDQRAIQVYGRSQRMGRETVGRVFSFQDVTEDGPPPEAQAVPSDLVEAARAVRVVPWYLTEDELVVSEKALALLALPPDGLPRDLAGLEALIHPADLDRFRLGLEQPRTAPFDLRMRKGRDAWIVTRWDLKRGAEGYRGVFSERPAVDEARALECPAPRFSFQVKVLQD